MIASIPDYAIGIRSHRAHASDAFAQPRCYAHALHGMAIGAWEYSIIAADAIVPPGWRVIERCRDRVLIKYTHWERICP